MHAAETTDSHRFTADDQHWFNEGTHYRLFEKLGAHPVEGGTHFGVWAPGARRVSVVGDFNGWDTRRTPLSPAGSSGIWEGLVPGIGPGSVYKYHVESSFHGYAVNKADPIGFRHEAPPRTGSVVHPLDYEWGDEAWMASRGSRNGLGAPISIYEVHLGSWMRAPDQDNRWLTYREIAPRLVAHLRETGFTHVEFMPVMEHPYDPSWGYQSTGYFAPTSRFGTPQDFMFLVDELHRAGFGVVLDWVPSHFPTDEHGLAYFDGTHLYEHADARQGFHPDWKSSIFNYGRHEVRAFLISSAVFWLLKYHADALRVDGVASMLYLDYSRPAGEWVPNRYGGRENVDAIEFLRQLNAEVYRAFPDVQTIAEESTAWPMVSRPTYVGGLGFGLKWDMGWMHDTLEHVKRDPIHRRWHYNELTFRAIYQFSENFVLPLSHDEVVHGKGSLLARMPGDEWRRFAGLRLLLAYQWAQPGKKLLFMGCEIGQSGEWNFRQSVDWHLRQYPVHEGVLRMVADLNRLYREQPALHERDCDAAGFQWVEASDADHGVLAFLRKDAAGRPILAVFNFTPQTWGTYRLGVPLTGRWREVFNSDAAHYAGSGQGNLGGVDATLIPSHGMDHSVVLNVPPLGALLLKPE
ncbi:MAG: 1,4-alpha-glucan branching protein GlgB [Phycisphaerales bacterium]|nr:1,4-alpha-glucan branching protein GlgB [Phycisphaerales bacterium]